MRQVPSNINRNGMQLATQKISTLLLQAIGLDVASIGDATLLRALNNRMKERGLADIELYFNKLKGSHLELRKLVEEVVVPETWFFRDQEPFNFLADYIFRSGKDLSLDTFRILSIPSSSGEEPYSVAMTLLQAGLKPSSFFIDAVDVSERVLVHARKGFYKQNSFRTKDLSFRDSFFHKSGQGYELNISVRNKVRFFQGNILQLGFMESLGRYDVVFCRNVLIYFNEESQKQAIESLYNLLMPEGLIFTGHSEASLFHDTRFVPASHSRSFAFYKQKKESVSVRAKMQMVEPLKGFANRNPVPVHSFGRFSGKAFVKPPSAPPAQQEIEYSQVRQMADKGYLEEAASLCEKRLRQSDPSAKWYYLLGVIRDSQGEPREAVKLLRKAVYLDPGSKESLVQLSLLAERSGDPVTAANYKRRAKKLQDGEEFR